MDATFKLDLKKAFSQHELFSKDELEVFLKKYFPDAAPKTISWRIHDLKLKGMISHVSRGTYSLNLKKDFQPDISNTMKRINAKIRKEFPALQFCIWETKWFNEFMDEQQSKNYLVIETEKDSMELVFNSLTDFSKKVFLNPDQEIFERYIANYNDAIIIKALVSEAPINIDEKSLHLASLEKLLVDALIDKELCAAQQTQLSRIFKTSAERYNLNISKLKRYARRRNQTNELLKYQDTSDANGMIEAKGELKS